MKNDGSQRPARVFWLWWMAGPFLAFAFYVLSAGPVIKLTIGTAGWDASKGFYMPLATLLEESEVFENFFDWYVGELWAAKMGGQKQVPLPAGREQTSKNGGLE